MESATDFKTDPAYFYCDKMSAWLKSEWCVMYQGIAAAAVKVHAFAFRLGLDRMYSCSGCEQGKEIMDQYLNNTNGIQPHVKPANTERPHNPPKSKHQKVKVGRASIDWHDIMEGYNRQNKKGWRSVKKWLAYVYLDHDRNAAGTAAYLGVSPKTLRNYMVRRGLPVRGRPDGKGAVQFLAIPAEEMAGMTKIEICRRVGLSVASVNRLIAKHRRRFRFVGTWSGKNRA